MKDHLIPKDHHVLARLPAHHGTVYTLKTPRGPETEYLAASDLESKVLHCLTLRGAIFYLWLIETRVMARRVRTGAAHV